MVPGAYDPGKGTTSRGMRWANSHPNKLCALAVPGMPARRIATTTPAMMRDIIFCTPQNDPARRRAPQTGTPPHINKTLAAPAQPQFLTGWVREQAGRWAVGQWATAPWAPLAAAARAPIHAGPGA